METQQLSQQIRDWKPAEMEWKFAFYTLRKGRDGLAMEIHACRLQGCADFADTIKTNLLEKVLAERNPADWSPYLGKESIGRLGKEHDLLRDALGEMLINAHGAAEYPADTFQSGALPTPKGYLLYGYQTDEEGMPQAQTLLVKRGNPFLGGAKTRLCAAKGDEIVVSEEALLKFTAAVDFLLLNGMGYFINPAIETDFGLESRHITICQQRLALLAQAELLNDWEQFEGCAIKSARKFLEFDNAVLEHIQKLSLTEREDFLLTYGVRMDSEGHIDTSDAEQCDYVIDLFCGRSCLDPLGRLATGSNIIPR